jgi:hypothetical protein
MTGVGGDLFEATGPYFGGPFDPAKVQRRKVGTMSIDLGHTLTGVDYTIDGVHVVKQVQPFTFRRDDLSGDYRGYQWQPPASEFTAGPEIKEELAIKIVDGDSTLTMTTSGPRGTCTFSGPRSQGRDFIGASGTQSCSDGTSGNWFLGVDVTPDGFIGGFHGGPITSNWGRLGASRFSPPVPINTGITNDLWFPPDEGGWGVNILEQGDTVFATLFVYDPQGKAHWYSASDLHRAGPNADDGRYEYVGNLYESTGPYFGTTFNASAVNRRVVGTMSFEPTLDNYSADLAYSVDGVQVRKRVSRFAFAKNSLTGTYTGHIVAWAPGVPPQPMTTMTIDDSNGFVMDTRSPGGVTCHFTAPTEQFGELRRVYGKFNCSDGTDNFFFLDDVVVNWDGFSGAFHGNGITVGHIEGVRTQIN